MISSSLFFVVFRFYFRRFPRIFFEIPSAFFRSFFFFFFWGALFRYRSIRAFVALFRYRSIRAFVALFRYRSIRAFGGYCPLGNTPPSRGSATLTPGCVLAPADVHFPAPFMERGGRQAGGEVKFSHAIYGEQGERPCRSSSIGFAVV